MIVLVACESSERVKKAFSDRGHDAHSCDLKPGEQELPNHHQCDIRELLSSKWARSIDLMIAHPDCTYLANSGVRWLFEKEGRWEELKKAAEFFNYLKRQPIPKICIENPQPHKWATELIGHYDIKVQPHWFGEPYKKGVCLWLKNLPPLLATIQMPQPKTAQEKKQWESVWREPPSPEQKTNRARTYLGIANAMAEQWGVWGVVSKASSKDERDK